MLTSTLPRTLKAEQSPHQHMCIGQFCPNCIGLRGPDGTPFYEHAHDSSEDCQLCVAGAALASAGASYTRAKARFGQALLAMEPRESKAIA